MNVWSVPNRRRGRRIATEVAACVIVAAITLLASTDRADTASAAPSTRTFTYTGTYEDFTVPAGVTTINFDARGGRSPFGGYGAAVIGSISVTPGEVLRVYVGGPGTLGQGGFPNGGDSGGQINQLYAYGGAGSTHIVTADSNETPIVVAGGGGGGSNFGIGGAGGYNGDDAPLSWLTYPDLDGHGGTQSAGGAPTCTPAGCQPLTEGAYMRGGHGFYGAGGGGGYYGGSGGFGDINVPDGSSTFDYGGTGGGGSSYVAPARLTGQPSPAFHTGWSDIGGSLVLSWTVSVTTTTTTSTSTSTTTSTAPTTTTTQAPPTTTTQVTTTTAVPPTSTTAAPITRWDSTPVDEGETSIVGASPFPSTGTGTVLVTNEMGYRVTAKREFIPQWRTRVYIGWYDFIIRSSYRVKSKATTWTCRIRRFGTTQLATSSNRWRTYRPARGCVIPPALITQLKTKKASITVAGTFDRRWATSGKKVRRDGSRITPRRVSLRVGNVDSVQLS